MSILIVGPLLGLIIGFVFGVAAMPFQVPGGRSAGDGFVVIGSVFVCILLSIFGSAALAWKIWSRKDTGASSK